MATQSAMWSNAGCIVTQLMQRCRFGTLISNVEWSYSYATWLVRDIAMAPQSSMWSGTVYYERRGFEYNGENGDLCFQGKF